MCLTWESAAVYPRPGAEATGWLTMMDFQPANALSLAADRLGYRRLV